MPSGIERKITSALAQALVPFKDKEETVEQN
jgi:hypothetical protein